MKKNLSTRDALLELRTVVAADSAKADKIKELTEQLSEAVTDRARAVEAALGTLEGYVDLHTRMHGFSTELESLVAMNGKPVERDDRPVRRTAKKKKGATTPNKLYHQLTTSQVNVIKVLHEKFGSLAHIKLGVSDTGFNRLRFRRIGDNIAKKTTSLLLKATSDLGLAAPKKATKKATKYGKSGKSGKSGGPQTATGWNGQLAVGIELAPKEQDFVDLLTEQWPTFVTTKSLVREGIIPKVHHATSKVNQLRKKGIPVESARQARVKDETISAKAQGYRLIF